MKLLTMRRATKTPQSADAVVAVIGGTAEQLIERFGSVGDDWMGRPLIAFEHACQAHAEWVAAVDWDYSVRLEYNAYQEDRMRRRKEAIDAATAAARAATRSLNRGGQESWNYLNEQWVAGRAALAEFDAAQPEITLSEFRLRRAT